MLNSTITSLDISGDNLGDVGVIQLCEMLKMNSSITSIKMEFTEITDSEAKLLAEALQVNSTLTHLNCIHYEDDGMGDFLSARGFVRKNQNLYDLLVRLIFNREIITIK